MTSKDPIDNSANINAHTAVSVQQPLTFQTHRPPNASILQHASEAARQQWARVQNQTSAMWAAMGQEDNGS